MNEKKEMASPPPKKSKLVDENRVPHMDVIEVKDERDLDKCKNDKSYSEFVTFDDLQKLREFKVLDEVKSNEEDSNAEDSDSFDDKSDGFPEEEIEKMLEEDLPEGFKGGPKPKEKPYITRTKIVLEEKGVNQFEVLPLDWMMVRHISGMPIYVHKATRVCTISKPYFLGKGNIRRHDIPISAIPCLAYRRALEEEDKQKEIDRKVDEQIKSLSRQASTSVNLSNETTPKISQGKRKNIFFDKSVKGKQRITFKVDIGQNNQRKCPFNEFRKNNIENHNEKNNETITKDLAAALVADELATDIKINENNMEPIDFTSDLIIREEMVKKKSHLMNSNSDLVVPTVNCIDLNINKEATVEKTVQTTDEQSVAKDKIVENDVSGYDDIPINRRPVILPNGEIMPAPRVESVNNSWKTQHLTPEQFNNYCKSLFKFKTVNILQFNRWADRRKYAKAKKALQYPTLPEGTKLIKIPVQNAGQDNNGGKGAKRDWVMNMNGGSYLSVFHEYVCRALQKQPVYEYKQLENASTPYQATVYIGGMQYGVGHGSSKRQAKYAAARSSIHILIPEMRDYLDAPASENCADPDFSFYDYVGIEDPRIAEFCASTCQPSPHAILRTCLLRNFGASDRHIHTEMKKMACQEIELTMKVGKHSATVVCKNKKTAKQRASQAILQFYDYVGIEDPRIAEFCASTCQPSPHAILRTCLLRNFGASDRHIHTEMKKMACQEIELTMKVGKHSATVVCKNKKTAKQRASQAILQALHPHVRSWGSLLRLYGSKSVKSSKEKKMEEQQITLLQDKARHNEPNYAVLEKLRNEMRKLRERDESVVPIGNLLVTDDLPSHSGSNLNNVDL